MSPGKKPNLSPASTAGLDKIILSIFFSSNIVRPTATAKKVLPVPAGPADIIISLCLKALTYSFCFSDLGIIDFLGVLMMSVILLFLTYSLIINLFTDDTMSLSSIDPLMIN